MRAMSVRSPGGLDNLIAGERGESSLGPTDVLLRVRASSVNYHDYVVAAGILPVKDGLVPLSDAAGDVLAVGAQVTAFRAGDRAMSVFYPAWQDGPPVKGYNAYIPGDTCDGFAA